ncbi:MAG: hypothetical protein OEW31_05745 [Thermoleophilia bacterium]|nr:hypothetical protein [Thermoleophilia bacterium]MDH4345817.1 hypothetical protein [Thermoleophilia bacterium]
MRMTTPLLVLAVAVAAAAAWLAQPGGASSAVITCGTTRAGYLVYANGVTCPTAKKLVTKIGTLRYRKPKVTITGVPGYLCVATYNKRTKKMKAGSCLRRKTVATGFGWTKGGAQVPLPPGVQPPAGTTP